MIQSLWQLLDKYKVVVPILQRDYAQGRDTGKAPVIRERFLQSLYDNIQQKVSNENHPPLELDFIYGFVKLDDEAPQFIPLDGQQRLTTLFLLHWFIAVKENALEHASSRLKKFTYRTRHSSILFCERLADFRPANLEVGISKSITDQSWFFTAWKDDPSISSMLRMLDAIQQKFINTDNIWVLLTSEAPVIVFHRLAMDKLGLADDLYIKMNSRGKELTDFEYFKSRFAEILSPSRKVEFSNKADQRWSDLFWGLVRTTSGNADSARLADDAFLRFFKYQTDMIVAQSTELSGHAMDEFELYKKVYEGDENVECLFRCLDSLSECYWQHPTFFEGLFYTESSDFEPDKSRLYFTNVQIDLFNKCATTYNPDVKNNPFSLGEQILLFACLEHLTKHTNDVATRIRKVRNLVANSSDELRKEYLPSLLRTTAKIMSEGKIDDESKFNKQQIMEEGEKTLFLTEHRQFENVVKKLEDHHLLRGCLKIFRMDDSIDKFAEVFHNIFKEKCDYDLISKALLTFGDYSQRYDHTKRIGNPNHATWRELFTPSNARSGIDGTHRILYLLLEYLIENEHMDLQIIVDDYLKAFVTTPSLSRDWTYYCVRYGEFTKWKGVCTDGFYNWADNDYSKTYEFLMMFRRQFNGRHWSPFLLSLKEKINGLQIEDYGAPLVFSIGRSNIRILNRSNGFLFEGVDDVNETTIVWLRESNLINENNMLLVNQDENGFDIEDRIEKGAKLIKYIISSFSTINAAANEAIATSSDGTL